MNISASWILPPLYNKHNNITLPLAVGTGVSLISVLLAIITILIVRKGD